MRTYHHRHITNHLQSQLNEYDRALEYDFSFLSLIRNGPELKDYGLSAQQKALDVICNHMRTLIVLIFFSATCYSQTSLQFDKVNGNDISNCQESSNGKICQSKLPLEIWLTRAALLVGKYETITLSFDGDKWKAKYFDGDWIRNTVDTFNLRPLYNYDTAFIALKKNKIFLLPNQKELTLKGDVDDGYDYMLTFKADNKFRTYEFNNPDIYLKYNSNISELRNYVNIIDILFKWLTKE